MTATTVGALFLATANLLDELSHAYAGICRERRGTDEPTAEFADFMSAREARTAALLQTYCERNGDDAALDVHVRLGAGFPLSADELELPPHATLEELIELAERTDNLLGQLGERIQVYAVSGAVLEVLGSFAEHVDARRRELSAALNELEKMRPSPRHATGHGL